MNAKPAGAPDQGGARRNSSSCALSSGSASSRLAACAEARPCGRPARATILPDSGEPPLFFVALATDYDGTLARHGRVDAATIKALEAVRRSGRKLILATGRDLPDLQRVFPELDLFDRVVAENGALLFDPAKKEETALADPPPPAL